MKWISVRDKLPYNIVIDEWSNDVIALADNGKVFRLACMNGTWQRSSDFVNSGAKEITHWVEWPKH